MRSTSIFAAIALLLVWNGRAGEMDGDSAFGREFFSSRQIAVLKALNFEIVDRMKIVSLANFAGITSMQIDSKIVMRTAKYLAEPLPLNSFGIRMIFGNRQLKYWEPSAELTVDQ